MNETDGYFETRLSYEPKRDAIWKPIVSYLQRYILEDARVLEIGAGYCSFINQVKAAERHALDKSDIIKNYAAKDVQTHVRNCTNLRVFPAGSFDVVFSSFLYEHLTRRDLDTVMRDLRRVLSKTGILITLLPNFKYVYKHYFDDYTHIQIFTHVSFADYLTSQGFEIMDVQGRFLPFSFKSRFPKSAFLTSLYLRLPFRPFAGNMLVVARNTDKPLPGFRPARSQSHHQHPKTNVNNDNLAPASILKDGRPESESKQGANRPPRNRPHHRPRRPNNRYDSSPGQPREQRRDRRPRNPNQSERDRSKPGDTRSVQGKE